MTPTTTTSSLLGNGPEMDRLRRDITRVAGTSFTVLIEGESGSGKELVAREIHAQSVRASGPVIAVNCAAIVDTLVEAELFGIEDRTATGVRGRLGKFELAQGGTLFLDEVADLSSSAQAKLLRAIQEMTVERVGGHVSRDVNARLVVATNRSLRTMVDAGQFRDDLYYRLSGVELRVPPLRERRGDIPLLARHFLARYTGTPRRFSPAALDALAAYDWPGNVRQLQRVIERAVAFGGDAVIEVDDLPPSVTRDYSAYLTPSLVRDDTMRAWGSRYARIVLARCDNNKRQACRILGISYHTLQAYLRYGAPEPEHDRHLEDEGIDDPGDDGEA